MGQFNGLTVQPLQRDFNLRPARPQCHVQSREHDFYFHGLVLHPARRLAASHGVHDYGPRLVCLFSDWLHHLSCASWREIFRIYRMGSGGLLSCPGLARSAGICDAAVSHFDAYSGFPSSMGAAHADCALDDPNLAVRVRYRSSRLFNALQMVSSPRRIEVVASAVLPCYSADPANYFGVKILRSTEI